MSNLNQLLTTHLPETQGLIELKKKKKKAIE